MHLDLRREFSTVISTSVELTRHLDLRRQRTSAALDLRRDAQEDRSTSVEKSSLWLDGGREFLDRAFLTEVEGILDGDPSTEVEMSLDLRRAAPRRAPTSVEVTLRPPSRIPDGGRGTSRPSLDLRREFPRPPSGISRRSSRPPSRILDASPRPPSRNQAYGSTEVECSNTASFFSVLSVKLERERCARCIYLLKV